MKIVLLLISVERSGGVRVTVEIAKQLARLGHESILAVAAQGEIPFEVSKAVKVVRSKSSKFSRSIGAVGRIFDLVRAVPEDADVIVASYYITAYAAILARLKTSGARLFYVVQGYEPNYFRQVGERTAWASFLLARASYWLPLRKCAISRWLAGVLSSHGYRNTPVINNGIDYEKFAFFRKPRSGDCGFIIMTVASRRPNRGYFDFCSAVNRLWTRRRNFRVIAIGADKTLAASLEAPCEFLTPQNDDELIAAYHEASVYVTCSHEEGFGLTPLEAMSCGTAVVCTDSGGLRDYARDGHNCLLVSMGDIVGVECAISRLMDDQPLREELITQGRATATRFDWRSIGAEYARLFRGC